MGAEAFVSWPQVDGGALGAEGESVGQGTAVSGCRILPGFAISQEGAKIEGVAVVGSDSLTVVSHHQVPAIEAASAAIGHDISRFPAFLWLGGEAKGALTAVYAFNLFGNLHRETGFKLLSTNKREWRDVQPLL